MSNPRQAALDELHHTERAVLGVGDCLTVQNMRLIKYALERQNIALRRIFEYADAVALEA
jgi:hypothetical protein